MIVPVVLNGWSASVKRRESRTAGLVRASLKGHQYADVFARRGALLFSRSLIIQRHIRSMQYRDNTLLLVAKSLGAKIMVDKVLNQLPDLNYEKTALLTIDPNWPETGDWLPNLNTTSLYLSHSIDEVCNVFVKVTDRDQQAGSRIRVGHESHLNEIALDGDKENWNHHNIIKAPIIRNLLAGLIRFLET